MAPKGLIDISSQQRRAPALRSPSEFISLSFVAILFLYSNAT